MILGLVGLVHAGESGAELIIPVIASLLRSRPDLLQKARVTAIPILNIDSREKIVHGNPWYLRKSHAGVDLNRNFPAQWDTVSYAYGLDSSDPDSLTYRGRSCGGTPEVRAAVSAIKRSRPRIIFSYHGQQSLSSLPVVASAVAAKDAGYRSRCEEAIEVYGTSMFRSLSFHKNWIHWAATEGSLATWAYELDRIPAFDIEMGLNQRDVAAYRKGEAGVRMLRKYQNLHAKAMTAVIEALLP